MTHDTPVQANQAKQSDSTDEVAIVSEEEVSLVSREERVEKTGAPKPLLDSVEEKRADILAATEEEESSKANVPVVNSDVCSLGEGQSHDDKADFTVPIVTEKEKATAELSIEDCSPNDPFLE